MTRGAESFCRKMYPKSTIEMRKDNGGRKYYLIREHRGAYMPIADGATPKDAWSKLRAKIERAAQGKPGDGVQQAATRLEPEPRNDNSQAPVLDPNGGK